MNAALVVCVAAYGASVAFTFAVGLAEYTIEGQKRRGARLMLAAPVWPVALPLAFGREIGTTIARLSRRNLIAHLWKEATRR